MVYGSYYSYFFNKIDINVGKNLVKVHLVMEDHRMEVFKLTHKKKAVRAFQGHGYTLGSPAPVIIGAPSEEDKPANEAKAKELIKVDNSKPTTK